MFWRNKKENKAKLEHKLYLARENPEPIFDLSDCGIRNVPQGIYSLCRVFLKETVDLGNNCLSSLSGGGNLKDLNLLKVLDLHDNVFSSIPDEICLLTNLKELYLHNNQLKKLPSSICKLKKLQILDLSCNNIHTLSDEIGNLCSLMKLNLLNNPLKKLPNSICHCKCLFELNVDHGKFVYPSSDIVEQGREAIMKFICDDVGVPYTTPQTPVESPEVHAGDLTDDFSNKLQAKIWEFENIKEQKLQEFLQIERHNELLQRQELELASNLKANKEKFLKYISDEQYKFNKELMKVQQERDFEKFKLFEQLQEVERNSDIAIQQLLALSNEPLLQLLEQEQQEEAKILAAANKYNESLRKNDILIAMKDLIEEETQQFKEFDRNRIETTRTILEQEMQSDNHIYEIIQNQMDAKNELLAQLQDDNELQKVAVGALLERGDARSWGLVQQVRLVESQLAALTSIELDRRKLEVDEHLNDIAEKRINLSMLLLDLLDQQELRRAQLLSTIKALEASNNTADDFWLKQYQRLLDQMPAGVLNFHKKMDTRLAETLLMAGVIHYLPLLAKWSIDEAKLINVTEKDLFEAGIQNSTHRQEILNAFSSFKMQISLRTNKELPSAPPEQEEASAPTVDVSESFITSECVICMDSPCQIIHVPCGHYCCCMNCSSPLQECPLCRSLIERKIRICS